MHLRQRDGVTCGPSVAIVAGALPDPDYGAPLAGVESGSRALGDSGRAWFSDEQGRVHRQVNRIWPRRLGATPAGLAKALTAGSTLRGVTYRWRFFRGRWDRLADVRVAVDGGWPVAMLIGRFIPRHWVLIINAADDTLLCYEPSSGEVRPVGLDAVRRARLVGLGFARPFAFVLPRVPTVRLMAANSELAPPQHALSATRVRGNASPTVPAGTTPTACRCMAPSRAT